MRPDRKGAVGSATGFNWFDDTGNVEHALIDLNLSKGRQCLQVRCDPWRLAIPLFSIFNLLHHGSQLDHADDGLSVAPTQ